MRDRVFGLSQLKLPYSTIKTFLIIPPTRKKIMCASFLQNLGKPKYLSLIEGYMCVENGDFNGGNFYMNSPTGS